MQFTAEQFQLWSRSQHKQQCARIEESDCAALQDHFATTYGIKHNSILNDPRYFHIVDGLPPDVMHDVLEGILQPELKLLLLHCINNRHFTLELLNQRMKCFSYGPTETSNRPSQISAATLYAEENSLKQSGMKSLLLTKLYTGTQKLIPFMHYPYLHTSSFTDVVPWQIFSIAYWG